MRAGEPVFFVSRPSLIDWSLGLISQENVRCIMAYIIHLTIILDTLFRTISGDISQEDVQLVIDEHVRSGKKDRIHNEIRGFVAIVSESSDLGLSARKQDFVLKKTVDLIQGFCVPDTVPG